MQIWSTLVLLIKITNVKMHQTVKGFGFSDSGGFSPFGCHLTTSDITELQEKFLKYLPPNFEYDGVKGGGGSPPHHIGV